MAASSGVKAVKPNQHMKIIEQILYKLSLNSAAETVEALHLLISELGARGGGVGMMEERGCPHILFTSGEPVRVTTQIEIYHFFCSFWDDKREPNTFREKTIEGRSAALCLCGALQGR